MSVERRKIYCASAKLRNVDIILVEWVPAQGGGGIAREHPDRVTEIHQIIRATTKHYVADALHRPRVAILVSRAKAGTYSVCRVRTGDIFAYIRSQYVTRKVISREETRDRVSTRWYAADTARFIARRDGFSTEVDKSRNERAASFIELRGEVRQKTGTCSSGGTFLHTCLYDETSFSGSLQALQLTICAIIAFP